ncbi:MAG: pyrroline-5-carboxylate reductase, partial [Clostridia bacterium]
MKQYKIGFIGAGNMATAILNGILRSNIFCADDIIVSDIDAKKLEIIANLGVSTTNDNKLLLKEADYVVLAIKPQVAGLVLPSLKNDVCDNLFISIMAGLNKTKLKNMLGDVKLTRVMPNTPCMVSEGMSAVDCLDFNEVSKNVVLNIFKSIGDVIELDESFFDAVTAVSGSGPAYVYMFIESMIKGGVLSGLDYETSKRLALQTFIGAVKMVRESDLPIEQLISNVCSKGGTTIQAVEYYNDNSLE